MPPKSRAQARYFGAVAAGKARDESGPTRAQAREMLRGARHENLPERVKGKKKRRKRDRRQQLIEQFVKRHG